MLVRDRILWLLCLLNTCFVHIKTNSILGNFIYCSDDTSKMPLYDLSKDCQELLLTREEKIIIPDESVHAKVFVVMKKTSIQHINNVSIF